MYEIKLEIPADFDILAGLRLAFDEHTYGELVAIAQTMELEWCIAGCPSC